MNISSWLMYWILRLDGIIYVLDKLFLVAMILVGGAGLFAFVYTLVKVEGNYEEDEDAVKKIGKAWMAYLRYLKWIIIFTIPICFLKMAIPSSKQMCLIIAVPAITNSELMQKDIPDATGKIFKLGIDYLETLVKEKKNTAQPADQQKNK